MTDHPAASLPRAGMWLTAARARSVALLEALAARTGMEAASFRCVAAAGSLGRLEAGEGADLDTLFIVDESHETGCTPAIQQAIERFFAEVAELGLREPKAHGIFRVPISRQVLVDPAARGRLDESPAHFGPRIQCLLDARCIHGREAFVELQREILAWYEPRPRLSVEPLWHYLESDLLRYAHAYRNWQRIKPGDDAEDSWALRQAKLHTTRHVTWLGLQALILRARSRGDAEGRGALLPWLALSPIERLTQVAHEDDASLAAELGACYEAMLEFLSTPGVRQRLIATARPSADEALVWAPPQPLAGLLERVQNFRWVLEAWMRLRTQRGLHAGFLL